MGLKRAVTIGIACHDGDVEAFVILRQFVVVAIDADLRLASIPLVGNLAHVIDVLQVIRCLEG